MQILFLISLAFFAARYINNLFTDKKEIQSDVDINAKIDKYRNVKYYSNGVHLNQPFHLEYKFILDNMEREREYEIKYQKILNEFPDEPIFEVDANYPDNRRYLYTYNHIKLAKSYFQSQNLYLEHLN